MHGKERSATSVQMVEMLTPIWQRVLQLPSIGVEDNFFDLGGDSSSAQEMFNAIAHACGRELPPVTIYQAPTITALAFLLEQPSPPRFPPLMLLKAGTVGPPVFITHGLGGSILEFHQVVKHIRTPHPIHGMQLRGIEGVDAPFDRIEDMAQYFLDAVEELQPHGPYLLIGYSLGGLVTLEMAQRLSAKGEKVGLLAMLDSYPHIRHLSPGQRARFALQRTRRYASKVLHLPVREALSPISRPFERRSRIFGNPFQPLVGASLSPAMEHVRDCAYLALKRYRQRFYNGKIRFVKAEVGTDFPDDPKAIWAKFAGEFDVETVPGDHLGIITTYSQKLASVLSRYIKEASCQEQSRS